MKKHTCKYNNKTSKIECFNNSTFNISKEIAMKAIKNNIPSLAHKIKFINIAMRVICILLLISSLFLLLSCTPENQDCDAELQKLEKLRVEGWEHCKGNKPCFDKIENDYANRKREILNSCR